MNEEQNATPDNSEANNTASNETPVTPGTTDINDPAAQPDDNYYAVDHAKKDVLSTIGDGEMHDEGLVGAGETTTDIQSSTERLEDEQDVAESHDSEQ